jgi:crotonobetainyl-CoA:carnitine CoA-transferase CaiB-like acyl-CoA transferase
VPERADLSLAEVKAGSMRLFGGGAFIAQSDGFAAHAVGTALLLGLVARRRGAPGQRLLTTMLSSVAHALSEDMVRFAGRPPAPESDPELFGFHALYRLYAGSEGWVFLAAPQEREWRRLARAAPFAALARDPRFADAAARREHDAALAAALAAIFATRAADAWERELTERDVACVVAAPGPVEAAVTDPDGDRSRASDAREAPAPGARAPFLALALRRGRRSHGRPAHRPRARRARLRRGADRGTSREGRARGLRHGGAPAQRLAAVTRFFPAALAS